MIKISAMVFVATNAIALLFGHFFWHFNLALNFHVFFAATFVIFFANFFAARRLVQRKMLDPKSSHPSLAANTKVGLKIFLNFWRFLGYGLLALLLLGFFYSRNFDLLGCLFGIFAALFATILCIFINFRRGN